MRRWQVIGLVLLAVTWIALTNVGSAIALSDIASRPILALVKGDERVPVQQPGQAPAPDLALVDGGVGVSFGYQFGHTLPGGAKVLCTIRFQSLTCDNGWTAERDV